MNDLRRHGEVAQDEVECAGRGGVEGLAGDEAEDVVGCSPLELLLRNEQGGPLSEPARAPCCQSLSTPCRVSTSVILWVRGPRAMGW